MLHANQQALVLLHSSVELVRDLVVIIASDVVEDLIDNRQQRDFLRSLYECRLLFGAQRLCEGATKKVN